VGEVRTFFSDEVFQLAEGDIAQVLDSRRSSNGIGRLRAEAAFTLNGTYVGFDPNAIGTSFFVGPGFIRGRLEQSSHGLDVPISGTAWGAIAILRAGNSVAPFTNHTGNIVIPENASGPVQIILEQSADMINWTNANPGTYDAGEGKRFFRLRAVVTK
jgi:hypothetical protein